MVIRDGGGGDTNSCEEESVVASGVDGGGVDREIAVPAEYCPVFLAEKEAAFLLADVAEWEGSGGGVEEGEAAVFSGEFVGGVDAGVTAGAENGLVGAAENGGRLETADVALQLHLLVSSSSISADSESGPIVFFFLSGWVGRMEGGEIGRAHV